MFKKKKLKPYLLTIFTVIIAMTLLITALSGVGLLRIKGIMQDLIDEEITAQLTLEKCRSQTTSVAANLSELSLTTDPAAQERLSSRVENCLKTVQELMPVLADSYGTADGMVEKYTQQAKHWIDIITQAKSKLLNGQGKEAQKLMISQGGPAARDLEDLSQSMVDAILERRAQSEASAQIQSTAIILVIVVVFLGALVLSILFATRTTRNITSTTLKVRDAVGGLAKGDLKARLDYEANNEFGELATGINYSFDQLEKYVDAIDYLMTEYSKGNFACSCPITFVGDFENIQRNLDAFQSRMNETLSELYLAAEQVGAGASQVSDGAQALAQGATEQASSTQELSASILDIDQRVKHTAQYSDEANQLGLKAGQVVTDSKQEMDQMISAIDDIAQKSADIQRIVKSIDDIAFQTNILALNAAVEAARAGAAGKGFAVVADEVRNLAAKSAEAAASTTALIDSTLHSIRNGTQLAQGAGEAFGRVAQYSDDILNMVSKIADASGEQARSINQVTAGMEQISSVIQQNSAASEESAAASEELSGQAAMMKSLLEQFTLKG